MLAVQIRAVGVGDASALGPGKGVICLSRERRKGKGVSCCGLTLGCHSR